MNWKPFLMLKLLGSCISLNFLTKNFAIFSTFIYTGNRTQLVLLSFLVYGFWVIHTMLGLWALIHIIGIMGPENRYNKQSIIMLLIEFIFVHGLYGRFQATLIFFAWSLLWKVSKLHSPYQLLLRNTFTISS